MAANECVVFVGRPVFPVSGSMCDVLGLEFVFSFSVELFFSDFEIFVMRTICLFMLLYCLATAADKFKATE